MSAISVQDDPSQDSTFEIFVSRPATFNASVTVPTPADLSLAVLKSASSEKAVPL